MSHWLAMALTSALLQAQVALPETNRQRWVPLSIEYPRADFTDRVHFYMDAIQSGPHLEPFPTNAWHQVPPPFFAPQGTTNVALGKKVTTSAPLVLCGRWEQVTDGAKEPDDSDLVEFSSGLQWVQVDLGRSYPIVAVVIWHENRGVQFFRDVVVQIADDAAFTNNVRTLFNNDADNSSGLGRGQDKEYYETRWGRLIDARGMPARYVRSYTNGRSRFKLNALQEIEVYALENVAPAGGRESPRENSGR